MSAHKIPRNLLYQRQSTEQSTSVDSLATQVSIPLVQKSQTLALEKPKCHHHMTACGGFAAKRPPSTTVLCTMPYLGDFSAVRVDVRLSVCPKRPLQQHAVGLLLRARPVQLSCVLCHTSVTSVPSVSMYVCLSVPSVHCSSVRWVCCSVPAQYKCPVYYTSVTSVPSVSMYVLWLVFVDVEYEAVPVHSPDGAPAADCCLCMSSCAVS